MISPHFFSWEENEKDINIKIVRPRVRNDVI